MDIIGAILRYGIGGLAVLGLWGLSGFLWFLVWTAWKIRKKDSLVLGCVEFGVYACVVMMIAVCATAELLGY